MQWFEDKENIGTFFNKLASQQITSLNLADIRIISSSPLYNRPLQGPYHPSSERLDEESWSNMDEDEFKGRNNNILHEKKFSYFPIEVTKIKSLRALSCKGLHITSIPPSIQSLVNLEKLDLSENNLTALTKEIGFLKKLTFLAAVGNKITEIPKEIGQLSNLQSLYLNFNELESVPTEFGQLHNLTSLGIIGNKLISLPISIGKLSRLKYLHLGANQLATLPIELFQLTNLETLILIKNEITNIPPEINQLKNLKYLNLEINPLSLPPEITNRKIPKVILDYYFSSMKKHRHLNEVKLLLVGQGSVGKTSIVQKILHNTFDQNQNKTEGISISQWALGGGRQTISSSVEDQLPIKLNLWDFGGQEIMHATHQFFLTKRSLYLLVLDSRLTQEENRVEYWLKIIQSFSDESPVLIVGNKIDQHPLDIDRTGLQKKYPNIVGILETSAANGAGIEELKAAIAEQVNNLPHVRDLLPETWFTVKTKLEELGRQSNFITHDKYLELCAENEVSDETSQRTLIGFLHDLGVVLHFQDDPRLEALGILNPQWVTNGVYKILNSHTLFQNKGVLTTSMLDEILNLPEYPRGKRLFIVDMMKKFELCYDIESDKTFLVPDLLPKDEPAELKFNGVPAFEYAYPVLPSSVITRFIVRMNQKIDDGFVWRTGVVLKIGENTSLVKADIEDRKITIAIDGVEYSRRDALSAIRYELGEIHNSIKGLNPQQRVPVPNAPLAEPLKYEYLLKLERAGQETVLVENGNDLVTVNVRQMLSAIETEAQRKEQSGNITHIYVGGNFDGNLTIGDGNQSIKDSYNKIAAADMDPELKQTLKSLADAISIVVKSFPEEKTAKVVKNFERLAEEVTQPEPDKQWYSVSIEGLIKAAENLDKLGTPVISLSRKVLSMLMGGANKQAR